MDKDFLNQEDYKYGFHDEDTSLYKTEKGLTRETVMEISRIKKRTTVDAGISFKSV